MNRRQWLRDALITIGVGVITGLLARYGIPLPPLPPIPPVEIPPITINPPPQTPPTLPDELPRVEEAIHRIQFGNAGCTATVIGPRRADGRWWILTASHCINAAGQKGTMYFSDGSRIGITVETFDRQSDCAWCSTDTSVAGLSWAKLAQTSPAVGTKIWHQGYGVDRPGNREDGTVTALANSDGQIEFRLSVSSGDSGGGICINPEGEVVSTVCCTSQRGAMARVWGASPEAIRAARRTVTVGPTWTPLDVPLRMPAKE